MSGIAAIIRFDGGPVEPGQIEKMTARIGYRGPDGIAHWQRGSVALGHLMLHTTAESLEETQPLANEDESLVLVMDGWVSNWVELRSELLSCGARLRTRSDAELVLRAYEQWGEDCPKHIDGEYAFLIWNARRREAYVARDHGGLRSLHYHWDGKRLILASDVAGVLAGPDIAKEPNRGMIAEIIANEYYTQDETVWQDIKRHLAAHWTIFDRDGIRCERYWSPPSKVSIIYKKQNDYVDHYRQLIADCVRRASRTHMTLACDVSGGLDSSAIFAMAHHLKSLGILPAPAINGYTQCFNDGSGADEVSYARATSSHVSAPLHEITPSLPGIEWLKARGRSDCDIPPAANSALGLDLSAALVADGCRVRLTGSGGDEWAGGSPYFHAEQITNCDWSALFASFRDEASMLGLRAAAWQLYRYGIGPALPAQVLSFRRKWFDQVTHRGKAPAFWLSAEMKELLLQRRATSHSDVGPKSPNRVHRDLLSTLSYPYAAMGRDAEARRVARAGHETRSPMWARDFIAFCFATPAHVKFRGEVIKQLHRKAFADLLPSVVVNRKTKAEFSCVFCHELDNLSEYFDKVQNVNEHGLFSRTRLTELWADYSRDPVIRMRIFELWGIFSCVSFLESVNQTATTEIDDGSL